jgi:hypothetical protein
VDIHKLQTEISVANRVMDKRDIFEFDDNATEPICATIRVRLDSWLATLFAILFGIFLV